MIIIFCTDLASAGPSISQLRHSNIQKHLCRKHLSNLTTQQLRETTKKMSINNTFISRSHKIFDKTLVREHDHSTKAIKFW